MSMKYLAIVAIAFALLACSSAPRSSPGVFSHTDRLIGQEVQVCGILSEDGNIYESQVTDGVISIVSSVPFGLSYRGPLCLKGTLRYIGCVSDPDIMCLGWVSDYGLEVTEAVWPLELRQQQP